MIPRILAQACRCEGCVMAMKIDVSSRMTAWTMQRIATVTAVRYGGMASDAGFVVETGLVGVVGGVARG